MWPGLGGGTHARKGTLVRTLLRWGSAVTAAMALTLGMTGVPASAASTDEVTIATFNASLNREDAGQLVADLSNGENQQARNVAETIQRANPDIVLVNEFDYDPDGKAVDLFRTNYLEQGQNGADPVEYPYAWTGPVNTGVPSGFDLNNDGTIGGPDDALGFGFFPGQYGLVVYSKYPIRADQVRTFQNFLWKDMPGALLPTDVDGSDWFTPEELAIMPLSSKTHADIPVDVNGTTVHVLAAHPTPPSFDGPEKRNQRRNADEIRLWRDYISGQADYLYDDNGVTGGLEPGANFVILGDYNADPLDGDSWPGAINQLLDAPELQDPKPTSAGAPEATELEGADNANHKGDPALDTANFTEPPGNLRVDYVLPNAAATVNDATVFWPTSDDPLYRLVGGGEDVPTSDHRMVRITATFPAAEPPAEPPAAPDADQPDTAPATEPPAPSNEPTSRPSPDQHPAKPGVERGLPKTGR